MCAGITGTPACWLTAARRANGLDPDNMPSAPERQYDSSQSIAARRWKDVWAAGQGVGTIRQVETVAAVVDRLAAEYAQAGARFAELTRTPATA